MNMKSEDGDLTQMGYVHRPITTFPLVLSDPVLCENIKIKVYFENAFGLAGGLGSHGGSPNQGAADIR